MASRTQIKKYRSEREKYFRKIKKNTEKIIKNFAKTAQDSVTKSEEDVNEILNKIPWGLLSSDLEKSLRANIAKIIDSFGDFVAELFEYPIEKEQLNVVKNTLIAEYNKKAGAKVQNISETLRKQISTVIREGQDAGISVSEIAKNIHDKFEEISEPRSRIIARTEVNGTTNKAHHQIAVEAELGNKMWVHTGAGKTVRENHKKLHNKKIKMGVKFDLGGGIEADHPHDPTLPAKEVISCHCFLVYS